MNDTKITDREVIEAKQAELAAMLERYPEAQAVAMGFIAGVESTLAKMENRK